MTADERLARIRVKVDRAKKHIADLDLAICTFGDTDPYKVETKPDPQLPGAVVYYLASVPDIPIGISAITGDILSNLRAALDHLAFNLVELRGFVNAHSVPLTVKEIRDISFPIIDTDSPTQYEASRKGKVKGMSQAAIDAIDATKPYKGGNDTLWQLHKLNNIDKHRFIVTVGSSLGAVNLPWFVHEAMMRRIFDDAGKPITDDQIRATNLMLRPDDTLCPLKAGDELTWDMPELTKNKQMRFGFEIAFGELGIAEREPILETLVTMMDRVDGLILSFKPLLS